MSSRSTSRPNVILVLTDDQGYPDLGCTGNPWVQTPCIDDFFKRAVRCNDFHVQPLCTPTRGALMSGRRPASNGAWATTWGRSLLKREETTMADVFSANGYHTGLFGKWHLGDNYPYRPEDRGFHLTVAHKGGGVGQTPDFWGNNYFNDTYFHNGQARAYEGYCTDVWFDQAMKFIDSTGDNPFFIYLATNAPHSPYLVADKYADLYRDNPDIPVPEFYGMITNIDENFGKLESYLERKGLLDNTILIFMTDNGTSAGCVPDKEGFITSGYNAGMRGRKASYYDGGHRVPFFLRWPSRGLSTARDIDELCLDIDLLPTLIDLCDLKDTASRPYHGVSLADLITGKQTALEERYHFLHFMQSPGTPVKEQGAVLTRRWRLVHGQELYDIKADPGQRNNIAAQNPSVVAELTQALDKWWDEVEPGFSEYGCISLGNVAENPTTLTAFDVMGDVAWNQAAIIEARKTTGAWNVEIEQPGLYRFSLRRWPEELPLAIDGMISKECALTTAYAPAKRVEIDPRRAKLKISDQVFEKEVEPGSEAVVYELELSSTGSTLLEASFIDEQQSFEYINKIVTLFCVLQCFSVAIFKILLNFLKLPLLHLLGLVVKHLREQ